jgi:6-phosphogluconolactonase
VKGRTMMRWVGRAAAAIGTLGLALATGCGTFFIYPGNLNGGSGSGSGDYVYVANATNDTVAGFTVSGGTLTALTGSPFALGYAPTAIAVNPSNSILFIASNSGIYTYSIAANGALNLLSSGVTSAVPNVTSMDVSPDGQWLFALDGLTIANVMTVYEFAINSSTGALAAETAGGATFSVNYTITAPASPITAPEPFVIKAANVTSGVDVFVALGTGGDLVIPFNTTSGVQLASQGQQFQLPGGLSSFTSDNALAVSNSVLYVGRANSTTAGAIAAYSVGSNNGTPTLSVVGQAPTGIQPSAVVVNKAGTDVYVANRTDATTGTISGFKTASGALTALGTYSSGLGSFPVGLAVDNTGNYLLDVANGGTPELTEYSFDSSGNLVFSMSAVSGSGSSGGIAIAATH